MHVINLLIDDFAVLLKAQGALVCYASWNLGTKQMCKAKVQG